MTGSQLFLKTVKQIVEIEHLPKEFLDKVQSVVHLTVYMWMKAIGEANSLVCQLRNKK